LYVYCQQVNQSINCAASSERTIASAVSRPAPVPMDTANLLSADNPRWVKRLPDYQFGCYAHLTSDAHVGYEYYSNVSASVVFDFGHLTYRVLKGTRNIKEDRSYAYLTSVVDRPVLSPFVRPAVNLSAPSKDIVPAKFHSR